MRTYLRCKKVLAGGQDPCIAFFLVFYEAK